MNRNAVAVTSVNPAAVNVEKINFAGEAIVNSRVALDPDFNQPSLIVLFDLLNITAVGAQSGTRYVVSSQEYVIQPLAPNQNIDFTFPMTTDVNAPLEMARTGSAHFVLQVDLLTGVVRTNAAVFSAR